ncbi:MAG: helix-turn-helix domain-containing protein [Catenulispora sp.]
MTELPLWLTVDDVVEQLRVSRWTVYRYINSRELPSFKKGRSRRIHRDQLAAFAARIAQEGEAA